MAGRTTVREQTAPPDLGRTCGSKSELGRLSRCPSPRIGGR
jgi:hypothetical protein